MNDEFGRWIANWKLVQNNRINSKYQASLESDLRPS